MRKRTGKLFTELDEAAQAELADLLLGGMKYWEALPVIKERWGVDIKSPSTVAKFWDAVCVPLHLARRRAAVETAEKIGAAVEEAGVFDKVTLATLKQKLFELTLATDPDTSALLKLSLILQRADDNATRRDELALKRDRFEMDAAALALKHAAALKEIKANNGLTERQKIDAARLRLFGGIAK